MGVGMAALAATGMVLALGLVMLFLFYGIPLLEELIAWFYNWKYRNVFLVFFGVVCLWVLMFANFYTNWN